MPDDDSQVNELLRRFSAGEATAANALFSRHRDRLVAMVRMRMHPGLAARLDPSDVVQDALAVAHRKLSSYTASQQQLPFYPWLRSIAWERLVQLHRQHLHAQRRTVRREEPEVPLPDSSEILLANRFVDSATSPGDRAVRREIRDRVRAALAELPAADREIVVLRHLEELPFKEVAAVVGASLAAVHSRYRRAVERLHVLLAPEDNP